MKIPQMFRAVAPLLLLAACAGAPRPVAIAPDAQATFRPGARIAVSQYPLPDFVAHTPGKTMIGLLGVAAMISEGNSFVKSNGIVDPAAQIGAELRKNLVDKYHLVESPAPEFPLHDDSLETIVKSYQGSDFVVDIKTYVWSYREVPLHFDSYHVHYGAHARLIDVKNNRVVAADTCLRYSKELSDAVPHEKLVENHGQYVRAQLSFYATDCANELARRMLKIEVATVGASARDSAAQTPVARPTEMPPAPEVDIVPPFLKAHGQASFKEFLTKPLPRAFAISDTAYFASVWGRHPKDPSKSADPKERALQNCREAAHKECFLYMVDNEVVYKK